MPTFRVSKDIIPLGEFKKNASKILRELRDHPEGIVITQNGKPAGVLLDPAEFDRLTYPEYVRRKIAQGLADVEAGRVMTTEELRASLDEEFGPVEG